MHACSNTRLATNSTHITTRAKMRGGFTLLWPLALIATGEQVKRTYSYNSFAPTLWSEMATETPASHSTHTTRPGYGNATNTAGTTPTATNAVPYKLQIPPLDTPWTNQVGLNPWPEHPRPQLKRDNWKTLNGIWTWESVGTTNDTSGVGGFPVGPLSQEILVPSCIESAISGLQDLNTTQMWYETTFEVPSGWGNQSVLLNFEAVDYEHTVYINGQQAGFFRGGYFRHTLDITQYLRQSNRTGGKHEL